MKLLEHEPEHVKDGLIEVLLIVCKYLIVINKLEINIEEELIVRGGVEVVAVEQHPKDLEVVFEVVVLALA